MLHKWSILVAACMSACLGLAGCGEQNSSTDRTSANETSTDGASADASSAAPGACARGTALDIAKADLERAGTPDGAKAQELATTIDFMLPEAPLYPCAFGFWAISAPDGSGSARLSFSSDDGVEKVMAFYKQALGKFGKLDIDDSAPVKTISVTGPDGVRVTDVNIEQSEDTDTPSRVTVILSAEGRTQ
jgi:hypothetical protein